MSEPELHLFEADRLETIHCPDPDCTATLEPDSQTVTGCRVDRERALGEPAHRPDACLNDARRRPIPF